MITIIIIPVPDYYSKDYLNNYLFLKSYFHIKIVAFLNNRIALTCWLWDFLLVFLFLHLNFQIIIIIIF